MDQQTFFEIDIDVFKEYLDEAGDMLDLLTENFLHIEKEPSEKSYIDSAFRIVHTIKGNSGFFNLLRVKNLAHQMEDLLNLYRTDQLKIEAEHITTLLSALEILKEIFTRVGNGLSEIEDDSDYLLIYDAIHTFVKNSSSDASNSQFNQLFIKFAEKFYSDDEDLQSEFYQLLEEFQALHHADVITINKREELKVAKGSLQDQIISILEQNLDLDQADASLDEEITKNIYNLLLDLNDCAVEEDLILFKTIFELYQLFVPKAGFTSVLANEIIPIVARVRCKEANNQEVEDVIQIATNEVSLSSEQTPQQVREVESSSDHNQRTMRINEESIDKFIDHIGELIIVGEAYSNITNKLSNKYALEGEQVLTDLKKSNEIFANISENLQLSILEIRKIPIGKVLQKAPKLIREISLKEHKEIVVEIFGDDIMIDKSLTEPLDGALVHLLRNAADHGIEPNEIRVSKGKSSVGKISIRVKESEDLIYLSVADDGKGIDPQYIKNKAIAKGVITALIAERMSDKQLLELIFTAGFSTAETVSDLSGRGVGMDVVLQNIIAMNGKISVDSEIGIGTTISIILPKSVLIKIINGFVVRLGDNKFILPMDAIGESVEMERKNLTIDPNGMEYALIGHKNYPLLRLNSFFNINLEIKEKEIGVVITRNGISVILVVDEIIGILKVVIKELEDLSYLSQKISGFALLGDETIASVLDLDKLDMFKNQ